MLLCGKKEEPTELSAVRTEDSLQTNQKRLSVQYINPFPPGDTKALPCTGPVGTFLPRGRRIRASFTVEAAFVFPMVLFALLVFMGFFTALQVQGEMTKAMQYAARKLAMQSGAASVLTLTDSEEDGDDEDDDDSSSLAALLTDSTAVARGRRLTVNYLKNNGCWTEWIEGGTAGISFASSTASGDYVYLCADYTISLPISFWGIGELPVTQAVRSRKWTGSSGDEADDDEDVWVYVTATGSAYHRSLGCSYLDLSIQTVSLSEVSDLRNKSGGKYYACSCMDDADEDLELVYITDYGTEYHASLDCSALKRTVYKIRLSEAGSYHACSKCGT